MTLSVIIPAYDLAPCEHRKRAFWHVTHRVQQHLIRDGIDEMFVANDGETKTAACNRAAKSAIGDVLLFLDADICLRWPAVRAAIDALQPGQVIKPFDRVWRLGQAQTAATYHGERVRREDCRESVSVLCGGAFAIHRDDWKKFGGFDESFGSGPYEDAELGRRLARNLSVIELQVPAYHLWHQPAEHPPERVARNRELLRTMAKRATPAERPAIACVLRTGGTGSRAYTADIARWLYRQCRRHIMHTDWEFVCLTDDRELIDSPTAGPFRAVLIEHDWPGWWAKIELFRPGLFTDRDAVLFLDLDTVLANPFAVPAVSPGEFRMLRAFTGDRDGWMSGAMLWDPVADMSHMYTDFRDHATAWQWCCRFNAGGDQQYIAFHRLLHRCEVRSIGERLDVVPYTEAGKTPSAPVLAWWAEDKPWNSPTANTPPMQTDASRTVLIGAWFGTLDDEARFAAAIEGLRHWTRLDPAPEIIVIDAGPGDGSVSELPGVTILHIETGPEHRQLWHKEALWNVGAAHALAHHSPDCLMFADLDCHWPDCPEIAALVQDTLTVGGWQVVQPFGRVIETDPDGAEHITTGYAYRKWHGDREITTGQGFALAMTADWFRRSGGFPDGSIEGGGDAVTCLCWDSDDAHSHNYQKQFPDWGRLSLDYRGPRTPWGCLPVEMRHVWHGARSGRGDTRHYHARHLIWEICGGREAVTEHDTETGLTRWRDTEAAEAAKYVRAHSNALLTEHEISEAYWGQYDQN